MSSSTMETLYSLLRPEAQLQPGDDKEHYYRQLLDIFEEYRVIRRGFANSGLIQLDADHVDKGRYGECCAYEYGYAI